MARDNDEGGVAALRPCACLQGSTKSKTRTQDPALTAPTGPSCQAYGRSLLKKQPERGVIRYGFSGTQESLRSAVVDCVSFAYHRMVYIVWVPLALLGL